MNKQLASQLASRVINAGMEYDEALLGCRCDPADGSYDSGCTLADARARLHEACRAILEHT